jgi:hypothetical protein
MTPTPPKDRMAASREARAKDGGKQIAVMLSPLAADKLARWVLRGMTATQAINKLLERSKP